MADIQLDAMDLEKHAIAIVRLHGAGSKQYASFLEKAKSTLIGATMQFPNFVPGDVKSSGRKKRTQRKPRNSVESTHEPADKISLSALESVPEDHRQQSSQLIPPARAYQRSYTVEPNKTTPKPNPMSLRRSQSLLVDAEQTTMDEQVAQQLQTLVREKAELIKENSRLKNENEGLKTLLEYARCEAMEEEPEEDYELSKEVLRVSGIQAWHPPELQSPTSFSSCGIMGSISSSEEKEPNTQTSDDGFSLPAIRT